eukprot:scaffold287341_cov21-Tisochrysis_lutea.AAC.1
MSPQPGCMGASMLPCYTSSTFSMVHVTEQVLCPSVAWGSILGLDGLLGIKLVLFRGFGKNRFQRNLILQTTPTMTYLNSRTPECRYKKKEN